ncbi:hypothetical protein ACJX0J_012179, partial [Zea mays]
PRPPPSPPSPSRPTPSRAHPFMPDILLRLHWRTTTQRSCCQHNIRKTTFVLHKLSMAKAKRYLEDIIAHRQSIVFRRYCGVVVKDLVVDNLYVSLIQVNLAQKQHKRIDTYMSSPCHSELFLLEKEDPMKKE